MTAGISVAACCFGAYFNNVIGFVIMLHFTDVGLRFSLSSDFV